ncbi:hypothetical protein EVG20_g11279, partial [Dentipellis fragilis]
MFNDADSDFLVRAWQILSEIGDQLARNEQTTRELLSRADNLKAEAKDVQTGFSLRRYNVDLSKETMESELERTNAHILIENQALLQENKQLSQLLKEHEETMHTVMEKFRCHSLAAQQHELTLTRYYDALLAQQPQYPTDIASNPVLAHSLHRLSQGLRAVLLSMSGEDPSAPSNRP